MYAIVKTGGKQYTVHEGDVLAVEKLDAEIGSTVLLPVITLVDGSSVITDADKLAKATVTAEVIDQFKGEKQLVFKFKKRKNYKRLRGHRQLQTRLSILGISADGSAPKKAAKKAAPKAEEPKAEEPEVLEAAVQELADDLEKMTVAQLKEVAAEKGVSLKGITKKADIIAAIRG